MLASFFRIIRPTVYAIGHSIWVLTALFGITSLVVGLLIGASAVLFGLDEMALSSPISLLLLFALQFTVALGFTSLLPLWQVKWKLSKLKKLFGMTRGPQARDIYLPFLVLPLYFVASAVVISIVASIIPSINLDQAQDVGFNADNLNGVFAYILAFFALVVMAPVAEELLFRGYLLGKVRPLIGAVAGALLTSIVFGAAHGQWNVGIDVFVLSLFLCTLRYKTDAIWACMVLHGLKNFLAYSLLFLAPLFGFDLLQLLS